MESDLRSAVPQAVSLEDIQIEMSVITDVLMENPGKITHTHFGVSIYIAH
jgi:hypothetical protein